jgi:hypothetical protein
MALNSHKLWFLDWVDAPRALRRAHDEVRLQRQRPRRSHSSIAVSFCTILRSSTLHQICEELHLSTTMHTAACLVHYFLTIAKGY